MRIRASLAFTLVGAMGGGLASSALADDASSTPPGPPPHPEMLPADPSLAPGAKRAIQDYEGRPPATTTAEDALWIPRVVFYPLYLFTDYVIRRPIGAVMSALERKGTGGSLAKLLTFGPRDNVGLIPTAFYDFGFRPSAGLYLFYDDN